MSQEEKQGDGNNLTDVVCFLILGAIILVLAIIYLLLVRIPKAIYKKIKGRLEKDV